MCVFHDAVFMEKKRKDERERERERERETVSEVQECREEYEKRQNKK